MFELIHSFKPFMQFDVAVYFTSALVLAFMIVYVWNKILWFVEKKGRPDKIQ